MAEYFDLCDERGRPLRVTKERALVHRDGDWHRSFHCWMVDPSEAAEPRILLQQRSRDKDTWGGLWDVSVGGHYSAGEGIEGGLREIREELGLEVDPAELVHAGWRRDEVFYDNGLIDREVADIFFLLRPIELAALRPDPREVQAIALVPENGLLRLSGRRTRTLEVSGGHVLADRPLQPATLVIEAEGLAPYGGNYYRKAVHFARALARGHTAGRRPGWW